MRRWRRSTAAVVLGLGLLAAVLVLWRLLSDAAGYFAPVMAVCGVVSLCAARHCRGRGWSEGGRALATAGVGAIGLAITAALSLGAFLPPAIAVWLSPVLGRFGGALALGVLAITALAWATIGPVARRGLALDLATLLGAGAVWIQVQTARQANFPTPPLTTSDPRARLLPLVALGIILGLGALALSIPWRGELIARWRWLAGWCWRWGALVALLGLGIGLIAHAAIAPWFIGPLALIGGAGFLGRREHGARATLRAGGRGLGWLALIVLALALLYGATSEDLEVVFLRNTVESRALRLWRGPFGDERAIVHPPGGLAGTVRDTAGLPLGGASVVLADSTGQTFTATSGPDGRYTIAGVPAGNYLPLAVGPAHRQGGRAGLAGRVATVRAGREATGVDFRLAPRPAFDLATNDSLELGSQTEYDVEGLTTGTTLRRTFTFANRGKTLDGGIIHEPPAAMGPGPFPILLIIYPRRGGFLGGGFSAAGDARLCRRQLFPPPPARPRRRHG